MSFLSMAGSRGVGYRGRLAPSPTGHLHLGHAAAFLAAWRRAMQAGGTLVLRVEDVDLARCSAEFETSQLEDLAWLGIHWSEGPDVGGPHAPYRQSERMHIYREAFQQLLKAGLIYPCICSRQEIASSHSAPHENMPGAEPNYPGTCRNRTSADIPDGTPIAWRFRVPDGEHITFHDTGAGTRTFVAGRDFGDFVVWRKDAMPSYQLACVVDDAAMHITEVVRGADLLLSTARQILLYRALNLTPPAFHHIPLVCDAHGNRLSKRDGATALRSLRAKGVSAEQIPQMLAQLGYSKHAHISLQASFH